MNRAWLPVRPVVNSARPAIAGRLHVSLSTMTDRPTCSAWFRSIPKVDLHLHLEGSILPSRLRRLAAANGVVLPPVQSPGPIDPAYRYEDFPGFLNCFKTACSVLRSPEDLALVAEDLLDRLADENVRYAEVFVSPVIHERRGIPTRTTMLLIQQVLDSRRGRPGPRCNFLFDAVRQWGPESCALNLSLAESCMDLGVVGIGLGGDERSFPAAVFAETYARATRCGLRRTVHAGEYDGPDSVREALRHLKPERIGHGIRAAEDLELLQELRLQGVTLDVCLTSNRRTGVWVDLATHPLRTIHASGVSFTLNTDDPALFDTSLDQELQVGSALLGLDGPGVRELILRSARASFLREDSKLLLEKELLEGTTGC